MKKTRFSLFYLAGYLIPAGLLLLLAPTFSTRLLLSNGNYGDVLNFPQNGGPGGCCGFFQPSQWLVNHFKTDAATGLPDPDHFNESVVKNDEGYASYSIFTPYTGTLGPR